MGDGAVDVDMNLRNMTVGDSAAMIEYDMGKLIGIGDTTTSIMRSFKRTDPRVRTRILAKYGARRNRRISQIIHHVARDIVRKTSENKRVIVIEDVWRITRVYRRNVRGDRSLRRRMNAWPHAKIRDEIENKAAWVGVPVVRLTKGETRGTSSRCPKCGEILQSDTDRRSRRELWCQVCRKWMDRDVVAAMNISLRGWVRFPHSKGGASEAMLREPGTPDMPAILRVDASKLVSGHR